MRDQIEHDTFGKVIRHLKTRLNPKFEHRILKFEQVTAILVGPGLKKNLLSLVVQISISC